MTTSLVGAIPRSRILEEEADWYWRAFMGAESAEEWARKQLAGAFEKDSRS